MAYCAEDASIEWETSESRRTRWRITQVFCEMMRDLQLAYHVSHVVGGIQELMEHCESYSKVKSFSLGCNLLAISGTLTQMAVVAMMEFEEKDGKIWR